MTQFEQFAAQARQKSIQQAMQDAANTPNANMPQAQTPPPVQAKSSTQQTEGALKSALGFLGIPTGDAASSAPPVNSALSPNAGMSIPGDPVGAVPWNSGVTTEQLPDISQMQQQIPQQQPTPSFSQQMQGTIPGGIWNMINGQAPGMKGSGGALINYLYNALRG